ncbi:thioredoxin family protein [Parasporobacterium paucivorans]|uniref:Thioredoxin n=1 Tax=Parasporobacterium paucivorans DSM 15970 TaxID=1122934 RepID=A0A1M6HVK1_9FIRM|nr:thioredoxin family protein [Parasporobacterium paucivorans]SHJ26235.1 Thioredoxin [Parasporobacterium paucivorans DSM 15970]
MQNTASLDEIQQSINDNAMVLIYFSGRSCGVCTALKPKIEEMLQAFPKIKSMHVDAEKSQDIAAYYNFFTIPAVLVFVEGKMTIREARCFSVQELNKGVSRYYSLLYGE